MFQGTEITPIEYFCSRVLFLLFNSQRKPETHGITPILHCPSQTADCLGCRQVITFIPSNHLYDILAHPPISESLSSLYGTAPIKIPVGKRSHEGVDQKLHQSLGSKQNPDPYVLFLQEFCGLKAVVSMCCIGFSDWRGDGTRNATCPCCATGHTFFNSHGVVFKEGEDSGKSGSEGRLGSCGGAEVSRTVDVSELFGIEVGGHNGH